MAMKNLASAAASTASTAAGDKTSASSSDPSKPPCNAASHVLAKRLTRVSLFFIGFSLVWVLLFNSAAPFGFPVISYYLNAALPLSSENYHQMLESDTIRSEYDPKLERVLRKASMEDKTVIITTLNDAWAEPGSIFDVFMESFRVGEDTERLVKHVVVITWDQKAYDRCTSLHPHCYRLDTAGENFTTEAFFMSQRYLHMMWLRIQFLGSVLQMGYNFVFTDTDIMWLRNPFPRFHEDSDFQIACDFFHGDPFDLKNMPNGGFNYVRSSNRTIWFYKFWYNARTTYPKLHDQDVLNRIKGHPFLSQMNLKIRFLDTAYFGGFCQHGKNLSTLCTMHANCCVGLNNKVNDLKLLLQDWTNYTALPPQHRNTARTKWSVPLNCKTSFQRAKAKAKSKVAS